MAEEGKALQMPKWGLIGTRVAGLGSLASAKMCGLLSGLREEGVG